MKKPIVIIFMISILSILFTGCYEGYYSKDGEVLKKYFSPEALKTLTENPEENIILIDVRPDSSYQNGHIPTALSYPSSVILSKLDEISKDKYIILYCETGGRAQAVIKLLEKEGYTKMLNWGGYTRWPYQLVR